MHVKCVCCYKMPTCATESLTRMWPSNESVHAGSSASSPGFQSPSSPYSLSPTSTSPDNTLRRRRIRRASSVGTIIQEPFVIHSEHRDSRSQSPLQFPPEDDTSFSGLKDFIGWYPCFLLQIVKVIFLAIFPQTWRQLIFSLPTMWFSMWIWLFSQMICLPITITKLFFSLLFGSEKKEKKRTVLISGGSTIQALHLARNFYSAGARVIVCEVEGLFALTRFSTAVHKFYTVPKPTSDQQQNYVRALCEIVAKENVMYYIPVSATTSAYYDAVAKPHIELLDCCCFCPGIKEVWALDDTLEVLKRCEKLGLNTPIFHAITSKSDIQQLYENGTIRTGKFVMSTAGPSGLRERTKIILPINRSELKIPHEINEQKPWVAVQYVEGDHYLTCTTVKESHVIANVTCKMSKDSNSLIPVESKEINQWLNNFFTRLNLLRPVTGHISFRFVITKEKTIVPLSTRVGVSLPYICYTSVHPRLVWKPCRHFSRQLSGPLVNGNGRYLMSDTIMSTLRNPSMESVTKMIGTVLDKREAIFALWDPLPYCAYYHMQLPFRNVLGFVQRRQDNFPQPMAAPVH